MSLSRKGLCMRIKPVNAMRVFAKEPKFTKRQKNSQIFRLSGASLHGLSGSNQVAFTSNEFLGDALSRPAPTSAASHQLYHTMPTPEQTTNHFFVQHPSKCAKSAFHHPWYKYASKLLYVRHFALKNQGPSPLQYKISHRRKMRRPHPDSIYTKYLEGLREQGGLNVWRACATRSLVLQTATSSKVVDGTSITGRQYTTIPMASAMCKPKERNCIWMLWTKFCVFCLSLKIVMRYK